MHREHLGDLTVLLAVAEERSFTKAAARLRTSQSAVSHTIRRLEGRVGVRLLTRTTRSVAPTAAGDALIATLRPALSDIEARLAALSEMRDRPAGLVRITTNRHAAETILWPALQPVLRANPDVSVELSIDMELTDIVAKRFDAGVRLGERVDRDMIALRIGPELRLAVVGSPKYFESHPRPRKPHDLPQHRCINLRLPTAGALYTWEFEKARRAVNVRVDGPLVFNDVRLAVDAAVAGFGLACVLEPQVDALLRSGSLVRVLEDWCAPFAGYHLYYPSRRQLSPAFALVLEALRARRTRG